MRAPRSAAPCAKLCNQVVARQSEQTGGRGQDAGQSVAMAVGTGGQLARRITAQHQLLAARALLRRGARCRRRRIRRIERGKVAGDLGQVRVAQRRQQLRHQPVVTPAFAEVVQLVKQITSRLAGDPRVIAVGRSTPLFAVANGTGAHPLRDVVAEPGRGAGGSRRHRKRQHQRQRRAAQPVSNSSGHARAHCSMSRRKRTAGKDGSISTSSQRTGWPAATACRSRT